MFLQAEQQRQEEAKKLKGCKDALSPLRGLESPKSHGSHHVLIDRHVRVLSLFLLFFLPSFGFFRRFLALDFGFFDLFDSRCKVILLRVRLSGCLFPQFGNLDSHIVQCRFNDLGSLT